MKFPFHSTSCNVTDNCALIYARCTIKWKYSVAHAPILQVKNVSDFSLPLGTGECTQLFRKAYRRVTIAGLCAIMWFMVCKKIEAPALILFLDSGTKSSWGVAERNNLTNISLVHDLQHVEGRFCTVYVHTRKIMTALLHKNNPNFLSYLVILVKLLL